MKRELSLSQHCVIHKFRSQASAYFEHKRIFYSIKDFAAGFESLQEECFCLIFENRNAFADGEISLRDAFLVECLEFPPELVSITLIKRKGASVLLHLAREAGGEEICNISVSLICTEDELYMDFLRRSIAHYRQLSSCGNVKFDFSLAFYGRKIPCDIGKDCEVIVCPKAEFSMAAARKLSLKYCRGSHVLMLDLDCIFSGANIEQLIKARSRYPNHGVFNLKNNYKMGNGLYFGLRSVLLANSYNEEFRKYWFEDTEYLMNFSRNGVVPSVLMLDFTQMEHSRHITFADNATYERNKKLFAKILKYGRSAQK